MQLSEQAWARSSKVIEAIKNHPFNQELAKGTLSLDKFAYYIEQDILYLQDFGRCQAIIASKVPLKYVRCFLRYADDTCVVEQEVVHHFFKKMFNFQETGKLTPATLSYTSYILRNCATEPVEIAVAAVLPCFWVYSEVGLSIAKEADKNNPYFKWIETYSSDDFITMVKEIIGIFDALALQASDEIRSKMLEAFYKSTCLEWHFWNDAYNKTVFDADFC
jgi:thiaminase/transcriptional activator TenA